MERRAVRVGTRSGHRPGSVQTSAWGGEPGSSSQFFTDREAKGWHHALRKFGPDEIRTYLDPKSAPYKLDHIFTDQQLHAALTSCEVMDAPALRDLSDHAALVADFSS